MKDAELYGREAGGRLGYQVVKSAEISLAKGLALVRSAADRGFERSSGARSRDGLTFEMAECLCGHNAKNRS